MKFITRHLMNPGKFLQLTNILSPIFAVGALLCFAYGIYLALFNSPPDYQQGETVRIMYIHVPAAWTALMLYGAMAIAAGIGIVARTPVADMFCEAAAPAGAMLTALCLITGSIWGKPTWGAWWVWDARLTSVLILFLIYCGLMILRGAFDDADRGARAAAILTLIGAVNLPIVHFSVTWWHSLHQGASVLREGGAAIAPVMLKPLLIMATAYLFYTAWVIFMRMRTIIFARRIDGKIKS